MSLKPKEKKFYVNNKEFLQHLVERKSLTNNKFEQYKNEKYIGEQIIKICNKYASKFNFSRYTYRDEMVSEGIIACTKAIDNYNTSYENPLAYFTMIAHNAFIQYITREKKQSYIRRELLLNMNSHEFMNNIDEDEVSMVENAVNVLTQSANSENLEYFEKREEERLQRKQTKQENKNNLNNIEYML